MTALILLSKFEYSMPPSAAVKVLSSERFLINNTLPVLSVAINFENGKMQIEGDWQFMVKANKHNENKWLDLHAQRVTIDLNLYSTAAIEIKETEIGDSIFPLEGVLNDASGVTEISGLLLLETQQKRVRNKVMKSRYVSFYLYDYRFDVCEIKFKLPLFINTNVNESNN